jgi:hypothetical protein
MTPSTASLERVIATTTDGRRLSVFAKRARFTRYLLDLRREVTLPT